MATMLLFMEAVLPFAEAMRLFWGRVSVLTSIIATQLEKPEALLHDITGSPGKVRYQPTRVRCYVWYWQSIWPTRLLCHARYFHISLRARCLVRVKRVAIGLCACYAMSGTDQAYGATRIRGP
eukprot:2990957-Rhodomonas_salina.1